MKLSILAIDQTMMLILVPLISLTGVIFSSVFGYISSYHGSKRSALNESKKLKEAHETRILQENKFEKDRILRTSLQDLTQGFYKDTFSSGSLSSYFNTEEGKATFFDIMSKVTAYGSESSVHSIIYLQKAISGSLLLKEQQEDIVNAAKGKIPQSIDWERYEINALTAIMIAQLRYDISQEIINPKELLAVKYNNLNKNYKVFFETGIDVFVDTLALHHFDSKEGQA